MNNLALLLTTIGFIIGCLATTMDADQIYWTMFGAGITIAMVGVILLRWSGRQEMAAESSSETLNGLQMALDQIVNKLKVLCTPDTEPHVYDLSQSIDEAFPEHLDHFVQGRKRIAYRYGVDAYAEVMTDFAAGERYLNRVWSASVDGYQEECRTYLQKSLKQFELAAQGLRNLITQNKT